MTIINSKEINLTELFKKLGDYKIMVTVILLLTILFYWYEIRPSIIKKSCYTTAKVSAIKKENNVRGTFNKDVYNTYYKMCLESKGL